MSFTRPGKRDLVLYMLEQQAGQQWSHSDLARIDELAGKLTIRDRYLWVEAEQDGKVLYTGAFAHWLARGQSADTSVAKAEQLARLMGR